MPEDIGFCSNCPAEEIVSAPKGSSCAVFISEVKLLHSQRYVATIPKRTTCAD